MLGAVNSVGVQSQNIKLKPIVKMDLIHLENQILNAPLNKYFYLDILRHEKLGEGVTRTICNIEGFEAVRIVQVIYGTYVGKGRNSVWRVGSNIVNNELSDFLENLYLSQVESKIVPVLNCPT
jgi:hypothetical protein